MAARSSARTTPVDTLLSPPGAPAPRRTVTAVPAAAIVAGPQGPARGSTPSWGRTLQRPPMPAFPSAEFRGTAQGLFSAEQVQRLMRIEFERAQRYGHPLVLLVLAVDRLVQLQDLYGVEVREQLQDELRRLVRAATRSSDLLGCTVDERLLVLVPHTPAEGAAVLARRILQGARRLRVDGDGRPVRVSLSIGGAYNTRKQRDLAFDTLVEVAQGGLAVAQQAGGDRYVHSDLYDFFEKKRAREAARAPAAATPARAGAAAPGDSVSAQLIGEKIRELFGLTDQDGDLLRRIEQEVVAQALRELKAELLKQATRPDEEHRREIDLLQRRIGKLTQQLGMTEEQLQKVLRAKTVDPGIASIYDSVQGLSADEVQGELKRELMSKIFEANVALRKSLEPRQ